MKIILARQLELEAESLNSDRPKMKCDKNEPFLMPQQQLLHGGSSSLANNRTSKFGRVTKFKHMKGTPMHKSMHFENLKNLSKSVPADCDIIQVSQLFHDELDESSKYLKCNKNQ